MTSVIFDLFLGTVVIGLITKYIKKRNQNTPSSYGTFCICYTKGTDPTCFSYITWLNKTYKTEEEYKAGEENLVKLALNKEENKYYREKGISGFAIIDMKDGYERFWCLLSK